MIHHRPFPLSRYRFEFCVTKALRLPDYAGSMLRGAFGHALRQLACMTQQKECVGCAVSASCPYSAVFAPQSPVEHTLQKFTQIPAPYIIEPPTWGSRTLEKGNRFDFYMTLIGGAIKELPIIILAWRRALARGIGAGDGTADLIRVVHCPFPRDMNERAIHSPDTGTIETHEQTFDFGACDDRNVSQITLCFKTPLRLQQNGHALSPERLEVRTLLMALIRRASLLSEFHAGVPLLTDFSTMASLSTQIRDQRQLVWRDWARYSSRQQQKMSLGGVVGYWMLKGELLPFMPFLRLGEWLHVGKEATFGMGGYALQDGAEVDISNQTLGSRERSMQDSESLEFIPIAQ